MLQTSSPSQPFTAGAVLVNSEHLLSEHMNTLQTLANPEHLVSVPQVAAPITTAVLQSQLRDILALCLTDGVDAWDMLPDGRCVWPAALHVAASTAVQALPVTFS